jgi:hypothetical protein
MVKGRIRVKSDYIKYRVDICDHGTEIRPRWGKLWDEYLQAGFHFTRGT